MRAKEWCVAWDGSPFVIRIDRRFRTRRGAERYLNRSTYRSQRSFVTTVADAEELDRTVWSLYQAGIYLDSRFDRGAAQ